MSAYTLEKRVEQVLDHLHAIAQDRAATVEHRRELLAQLATVAAHAKDNVRPLRECIARRITGGRVDVRVGAELWRLADAEAVALRDQLDVALHMPAPPIPPDQL